MLFNLVSSVLLVAVMIGCSACTVDVLNYILARKKMLRWPWLAKGLLMPFAVFCIFIMVANHNDVGPLDRQPR